MMRNFTIILIFIVVSSCSQKPSTIIRGEIDKLDIFNRKIDSISKCLYLIEINNGNNYSVIDSVIINETGRFELSVENKNVKILYLSYENPNSTESYYNIWQLYPLFISANDFVEIKLKHGFIEAFSGGLLPPEKIQYSGNFADYYKLYRRIEKEAFFIQEEIFNADFAESLMVINKFEKQFIDTIERIENKYIKAYLSNYLLYSKNHNLLTRVSCNCYPSSNRFYNKNYCDSLTQQVIEGINSSVLDDNFHLYRIIINDFIYYWVGNSKLESTLSIEADYFLLKDLFIGRAKDVVLTEYIISFLNKANSSVERNSLKTIYLDLMNNCSDEHELRRLQIISEKI